MKIIIIAAVSKNNVIGKDGSIPWHSKAELKHFKNTTMGFPIIMGRKTFESIGRALPGRENVVITSKPEKFADLNDIVVASSLEDAVSKMKAKNYEKLFVIGGGVIYNEAMNIADELLITRMPLDVKGDTFFPEIKERDWELVEAIENDEFNVERYERLMNGK